MKTVIFFVYDYYCPTTTPTPTPTPTSYSYSYSYSFSYSYSYSYSYYYYYYSNYYYYYYGSRTTSGRDALRHHRTGMIFGKANFALPSVLQRAAMPRSLPLIS